MGKRVVSLFSAVCVLMGLMIPGTLAAETGGRVVLEAGATDDEGCFTMEMRIYNAKFNAFQFVLWYDSDTVVPVDSSGEETEDFSAFAQPMDDGWMSVIGTGIDTGECLIDFTGYITPGEGVAVDAPEEDGIASVGESGLTLFTFRFKQVGEEPVVLALAAQDSGHPFRSYLPQGGAVVNAGESIPLTLVFAYPQGMGAAGETEVEEPETEPPVTAERLLDHSLILRTGSHVALAKNWITAIYSGEREVVPFLRDGTIYLPVAFVAQRLGAQVSWEGDTGTVVIVQDGRTTRLTVGADSCTTDGVAHPMEAPAVISGERSMAPAQFFTEVLGWPVIWDSQRQLAAVSDGSVTWNPESDAAQAALNQAMGLLALYGNFV